MGTKISMVSVSKLHSRLHAGNSISLSAHVVKESLFISRIAPSEIGLLINTGIYRYRNTGEPSIASLIQRKVIPLQRKLSKEDEAAANRNIFSFDLSNGGCGWLSAIEIIDGFIQTGQIHHGLVVTADSEPFPGFSENYNFRPAAAAIILSGNGTAGGFMHFRTYSFPGFSEEFTGATRFGRLKGRWGKRNILVIRERETFAENCVGCALTSLNSFFNETGYSLKDIDLIIPSQCPEGFLRGIMERSGFSDKFVVVSDTSNKVLHTAGPAFALNDSWNDNRFRSSGNILFLTVGSGITVSIALYKNYSS
jgi:3-oxoacyl-[acyl-carrier-protein] synthase III